MNDIGIWLDQQLSGCKEIGGIYSKLKKDVENLKKYEQYIDLKKYEQNSGKHKQDSEEYEQNLKRYEHYAEIFKIVKTNLELKFAYCFDEQITGCEEICKTCFEQGDSLNYEKFGHYIEAYKIIESHIKSGI